MFSGSSKSKDRIAAIFDIGNGSVGCSLVEAMEGSKPTIIWSYTESMALHDEIDSEKLLLSMQKHIKSVASKVSTEGAQALSASQRKAPIEAICVFSSPWYVSHTKKVLIEKEKPFTVTERMLNDILLQEEAAFQKVSKDSNYGKMFADTKVIERKVIETKVSGYQIQNPKGKSTKCLEVTLFTSLVSKELLVKVENVIHSCLHFKKVAFHSYTLAAFSVIRDLFSAEDSFLFFYVSAELTELSAVRKGILVNTLSFPMGTNSMLRRVSGKLKTTHEVAASLIKMHGSKTAEEATAVKVEAALANFQREWCGYLHKSFTEISKEVPLPERIFLLAENDFADFFSAAIEKGRCFLFPNGMGESDEKYSVVLLNEEKLKDFVEVKSRLVSTSALLQTLFFTKLFNL